MTKIFYDHLIKIEEVCDELNNCELNVEEKEEFITLIDETIDNKMIDAILDMLPEEYHKTFLTQFHQAPYDKALIKFLKEKVSGDIDEIIEAKAKEIKKELLAEIKKSKKPKPKTLANLRK